MKKLLLILTMMWGVAVCGKETLAPSANEAYVIKIGDNLWNISQKLHNNPFLWEKFVADNPYLQEAGRVRIEGPGAIFVRLNPGEVLNQTALAPETTLEPQAVLDVRPTTVHRSNTDILFDWVEANSLFLFWTLIILMVLIGVITLLAKLSRVASRIHEDPLTAGPPQIRGGVSDETIESVLKRRYPNIGISNIERGILFGQGITSYGDNLDRKTRYNGVTAYRATATHENGHTELVYCLQPCANEARIGQGIHGENLRFIPEARISDGKAGPIDIVQQQDAESQFTSIAKLAIESAKETGSNVLIEIKGSSMSISVTNTEPSPFSMMGILLGRRSNREREVLSEEEKLPVTAANALPGSMR